MPQDPPTILSPPTVSGSEALPDALFEPLGDDRYHPTNRARGPWSPDALHGGPVAALLAGAGCRELGVERDSMVPVRLTVELLRPVPLSPLRLSARTTRPGRKVRLAAVDLADEDGRVVASASLLAIRAATVSVPDQPPEELPPPPDGLAAAVIAPDVFSYPAFHNTGVEHRFVEGAFDQPGPALDWIRLAVPVVAGESVLPLQRVAAASDFGNGISGLVGFGELSFINPDLTVTVRREPVGEWVCLQARSRLGANGVGLAESTLFDRDGHLGRAVQTLLVEPIGG